MGLETRRTSEGAASGVVEQDLVLQELVLDEDFDAAARPRDDVEIELDAGDRPPRQD